MLREVMRKTIDTLKIPSVYLEKQLVKSESKAMERKYDRWLEKQRNPQLKKLPYNISKKYGRAKALKNIHFIFNGNTTQKVEGFRNIVKENQTMALPEIKQFFTYTHENRRSQDIVRLEANIAVKELGGEIPVDRIESFLHSPAEDVVERTIGFLVNINSKSSRSEIERLKNHESPKIRAIVLEALKRLE